MKQALRRCVGQLAQRISRAASNHAPPTTKPTTFFGAGALWVRDHRRALASFGLSGVGVAIVGLAIFWPEPTPVMPPRRTPVQANQGAAALNAGLNQELAAPLFSLTLGRSTVSSSGGSTGDSERAAARARDREVASRPEAKATAPLAAVQVAVAQVAADLETLAGPPLVAAEPHPLAVPAEVTSSEVSADLELTAQALPPEITPAGPRSGRPTLELQPRPRIERRAAAPLSGTTPLVEETAAQVGQTEEAVGGPVPEVALARPNAAEASAPVAPDDEQASSPPDQATPPVAVPAAAAFRSTAQRSSARPSPTTPAAERSRASGSDAHADSARAAPGAASSTAEPAAAAPSTPAPLATTASPATQVPTVGRDGHGGGGGPSGGGDDQHDRPAARPAPKSPPPTSVVSGPPQSGSGGSPPAPPSGGQRAKTTAPPPAVAPPQPPQSQQPRADKRADDHKDDQKNDHKNDHKSR